MGNLEKFVILFLMGIAANQVHAVTCTSRYAFYCAPGTGEHSYTVAQTMVAQFDCNTQAVLSRTDTVRNSCRVDYSRYLVNIDVLYTCAEVGLRPGPGNTFRVTYSSSGPNWVTSECANPYRRKF